MPSSEMSSRSGAATGSVRSTLFAAAAVALAVVAPAPASAEILANGSYFQSDLISSDWMWQASGTLLHNQRCPLAVSRYISDCWGMFLDQTGNLQSTTQADYLASLNTTQPARRRRTITFDDSPQAVSVPVNPEAVSSGSIAARGMSPAQQAAEQVALADDLALDAYFEAFPEQASTRYVAAKPRASPSARIANGTFNPSSTEQILAASSPRQRNEILTWPGAPAGETWHYTWKSYQSAGTGTNDHFFHAWQILRRDADGGPVVTLDYENGKVFIEDIVRGCKLCNGIWRRTHDWFAQTIMHDLKITYGVNGSIDYSAYIAPSTKNAFFRYTSTNRDMGSSASLKFGNYRLYTTDLTQAAAYVGDFTQTRLSA